MQAHKSQAKLSFAGEETECEEESKRVVLPYNINSNKSQKEIDLEPEGMNRA